jgi:hypothetical protein
MEMDGGCEPSKSKSVEPSLGFTLSPTNSIQIKIQGTKYVYVLTYIRVYGDKYPNKTTFRIFVVVVLGVELRPCTKPLPF